MQFTRISLSVSALLFCLAFALPLSAQTEEPVQAAYPAILADMTHVKVVQDSSITLLMQDKRNGIESIRTTLLSMQKQRPSNWKNAFRN